MLIQPHDLDPASRPLLGNQSGRRADPIELLNTELGVPQVEELLIRIDYGFGDLAVRRPEQSRSGEVRTLEGSMKKLHHKAKAQKAIAVCYHLRSRQVVIELDSGLELRFRLRDLSGPSLGVSARDLTTVEITPSGSAVFWPRLAMQASIFDLLTGQLGVKRWRARRNSFAARFLKLKGSVPADIDLEF